MAKILIVDDAFAVGVPGGFDRKRGVRGEAADVAAVEVADVDFALIAFRFGGEDDFRAADALDAELLFQEGIDRGLGEFPLVGRGRLDAVKRCAGTVCDIKDQGVPVNASGDDEIAFAAGEDFEPAAVDQVGNDIFGEERIAADPLENERRVFRFSVAVDNDLGVDRDGEKKRQTERNEKPHKNLLGIMVSCKVNYLFFS